MRWDRSCRVGRAERGPPHSHQLTWRARRQIGRHELEQHRKFLPTGMVIQARLIGLDLGMSGIRVERFGHDAQPQRPNLRGPNTSDARTCLALPPTNSSSRCGVVIFQRVTDTPVSCRSWRSWKFALVIRGPGACQSVPPGICRRRYSSSATSSMVVLP